MRPRSARRYRKDSKAFPGAPTSANLQPPDHQHPPSHKLEKEKEPWIQHTTSAHSKANWNPLSNKYIARDCQIQHTTSAHSKANWNPLSNKYIAKDCQIVPWRPILRAKITSQFQM
ncbi:uncharacterized protein LOC135441076 [Drosophila montana]|uniref:uncharacterized protein LOC135441076 n=1 Tax=Drosophila montana TaxID=40370 RepID=UPI00313C5B32